MLFIPTEITGKVEITWSERHQRINVIFPHSGRYGYFVLLAVLSARPVPQISFRVTWQSRHDARVQVRVGSTFGLSKEKIHMESKMLR